MAGTGENKNACFVIGITGPSGSGKTSLAKSLVGELPRAVLIPEDPKFFKAPAPASYRDRDPISETPSHVDWDAYLTHLQHEINEREGDELVLVEHFLLLHDARVVQELDALLFLENFGNWKLCRDRRIQRNPIRSGSECKHLSQYYENHVWPNYQLHCQSSARQYCLEFSHSSKVLDCHSSLKEMVDQALHAIREWTK